MCSYCFMGDNKKNWGNEPSLEGMGVIQGLLGIPYKGPLTKGELVLQQNERIARGVEAIVERIPDADYEVIASSSDDDAALERVRDAIMDGFGEQMEGLNDISGSLEDILGVNEYMADGIDELNETARRTEKISGHIRLGVGAILASSLKIASDTGAIRAGIDDLNDTAEGIYEEVSDISEGVWELTEIQERQTKLVKKIGKAINKHGARTNNLLSELARLTVEHIRMTARFHELQVEGMKRIAAEAVAQIIVSLLRIESTIECGLDSVRGEIQRQTEVTTSFRKDSLAIEATQYRDQGRKLYEKNHPREALARLLLAFGLDNTDFETNLLLFSLYISSDDEKKAARHYALASSFAPDKKAMAGLDAMAAKYEQAKGNKEGAAEKAVMALKGDPSIFFTYLADTVGGLNGAENVWLPLLEDHGDDINVLALCAVELFKHKKNGKALSAIRLLIERMDAKTFDGRIREHFVSSLHGLSRLIEMAIDISGSTVKSTTLLHVARMLLEAGQDIDSARKYINEAYNADKKIAGMVARSDYKGIVEYLKFFLGEKISHLKRFGEIPVEIRSIIFEDES